MEIVEVFKTNVETGEQAARLMHLIHENFPEYTVNFDLDDCDRVLRVKSCDLIHESRLIQMFTEQGFEAELLADEIPPFVGNALTMSL